MKNHPQPNSASRLAVPALAVGAFLCLTQSASAGGLMVYTAACVAFAAMDVWAFIIPFWFLCQSIPRTICPSPISMYPHFVGSVVVALIVHFIALEVGYAFHFVLAFPPLLAFIEALKRKQKRDPKGFVYATRSIGAVALVLLVTSTAYQWGRIDRMTSHETLTKWRKAGLPTTWLGAFQSRDPAVLEQYRARLGRETVGLAALEAAESLVDVGQADIDVPLLIDAYDKATSGSIEDDETTAAVATRLEQALRELSGIDLPEASPPDNWRRAWEAR